MTQPLIARAPGKLFLLGEYAVLDGAPAIVAAVDRSIEVRIARLKTRTVRISAPGQSENLEFPAGAPPAQHSALRFALRAYAHAIAARPPAADAGLELCITSHLDGDNGVKLGLGSSAAVTVAVVAAILALTDRKTAPRHADGWRPDDVFPIAWRAHRDAQGGVGSGADVAASTYGGIVRFEPRGFAVPRVVPLPRPVDAILLTAWTGAAAATVELVKHYTALPRAGARMAFRHASRACVDWLARALQRGTFSAAALDAGGAALAQLAAATGLPLLTPRLTELVAIARTHGGAAKPAGAGGGDCGIALASNAAAAQRIQAAWRAAGILPLDVSVSGTGVTVATA